MNSTLLNMLLATSALSVACALLSVVVVVRRWAFIGEGISHSGFGGAGTAWILMLLVPALDQSWMPYATLVIFSLATALAIGALSRGKSVNIDAAIGIFLVASLAWGFLAQQIYTSYRHASPASFENLLFGQLVVLSPEYTTTAIVICFLVIVVLAALWKEILAYCFDPLLSATSGVRAGFIHYLLILLIALVIIFGARIAGTVLITAPLILPGATALLLSRKLGTVLVISVAVALIGTVGGVLISRQSHSLYLPAGPVIVLLMFVEFLAAYGVSRISQRSEM